MTHAGGRPTDYTPEVADTLCSIIASSTMSVKDLCHGRPEFPDETTFYRWMFKHDGFRQKYLEAKELQGLIYSDEIMKEARECPAVSEEIALHNHIFRVTQWHLSKLAPKQFGDKKEIKQEMNLNVHEQDLAHLK